MKGCWSWDILMRYSDFVGIRVVRLKIPIRINYLVFSEQFCNNRPVQPLERSLAMKRNLR